MTQIPAPSESRAEELNERIRATLRGLQGVAGLNDKQLALKSGVAYNTVRDYLYGNRSLRVDTIDEIAAAFDLTAFDIIRMAAAGRLDLGGFPLQRQCELSMLEGGGEPSPDQQSLPFRTLSSVF